MNSERTKKLRLNMMQGRPSEACSECYKIEKCGEKSVRQEYNHYHKKYFNRVTQTRSDGAFEEFSAPYLNLSLSNQCQLKCRSCGPYNSSAWQVEAGPPENYRALSESSAEQRLLDFISNDKTIEAISFAGGEPVISGMHYKILDLLIEQGRENTSLLYNSNFVQLTWKSFDISAYWNRFKKVETHISIDGIYKRFDYVRTGHEWSRLVKNIKLMRAKSPHVQYRAAVTFSLYNFLYMPDILDALMKECGFGIRDISFNLLHEPVHMSPQNAPAELKADAKKRYIKYMKKLLIEYDSMDAVFLVSPLKMLINFMFLEEPSTEKYQQFLDFNHNSRVPRLAETFPGLFSELLTVKI